MIHYFLLPLLLAETTNAYASLKWNRNNQLSRGLNSLSTDISIVASSITGKGYFASSVKYDSTITSTAVSAASSSSRFVSSSSSRQKRSSADGNKIVNRGNTALFSLPTGSNAESTTAEVAVPQAISERNMENDSKSTDDDNSNNLQKSNIDLHVQHQSVLESQLVSTSESHEVQSSTPLKTETVIAIDSIESPKKVQPHMIVVTRMEAPVKIEKKKENGFKKFLKGNWLVIGEVLVIMLAKMNPSFGATGGRLRPEFFISKLGVFTIFFINGIALSIGKKFFLF